MGIIPGRLDAPACPDDRDFFREAVGAISYGSYAGYVSVRTDGTVYCTSKAADDFSGQVCFVV